VTDGLPPKLYDTCRARPEKVLLYPGEAPHVIRAARILQDAGLARPVLLGGPFTIRDVASEQGLVTRGLSIEKPLRLADEEGVYAALKRTFFFKDLNRPYWRNRFSDPLTAVWGALFTGRARAGLAGIDHTMHQFLKTLLPLWKARGVNRHIFSFYALSHPATKRLMLFGDCSFNIRSGPEQLGDRAVTLGRLYKQLTGEMARVALLSFATMDSADHPKVETVRRAAEWAHKNSDDVLCDGPYQVDAALDAAVAAKKAPHGRLKGNANVFIFPTLDSGNIAVKMAEHLGGWQVTGPMITGSAENLHFITAQANAGQIVRQAVLALNMKNNLTE